MDASNKGYMNTLAAQKKKRSNDWLQLEIEKMKFGSSRLANHPNKVSKEDFFVFFKLPLNPSQAEDEK